MFQTMLLWSILVSKNNLYALYNFHHTLLFLIIQEFIFEFSFLWLSVKEVWQSNNFISDNKGSSLFEASLLFSEKHINCLIVII